MSIERRQIEHVAALANLNLEEAELALLERDLGAVLAYIQQLQSIDTAGVAPMAHVLTDRAAEEVTLATVRPDRVVPGVGTDAALANAPAAESGMFVVPRILDRG